MLPIIEEFQRAGQGQVFAFFDRLSPAERESLVAEAGEIDLGEIARLTETLLRPGAAAGTPLAGVEPAPYEARPESGGTAASWDEARARGEAALRDGRVAAFTVAGGQGTRLGYDGPKGTFPVTPVTGKPLFQVFAEKIKAAGIRYGRDIPWYVMTSHQNHAATESFFAEHDYFGLDRARVRFFRQGRMPAVDFEGRILLESPGRIALSPDGHGGSLRALERSGALAEMARDGIDTISYFQVDNPLVRCIDPEFIGWHLIKGSEMSCKMVPKVSAEEKVGVFCAQGGQTVVIEYSDLPVDLQREVDPATGRLRFLAGSIAVHLLDREFVRRQATGGPESALPFHRADKKIPTVDAEGAPVKPAKPNGVKFEMFVFDALPFARNPLVVETRREDDFAPVKNAEGSDSPATCRQAQVAQFGRWLRAAGASWAGESVPTVEVSPLFGYDAATFAESWARLQPKPAVADGLCLG